MKTLASKSYTIAWFKIADFISRGEKERALHMYPLLMHSISEEAIAYQLEGDILLSFDDWQALKKYQQAVICYKKSGKIKQAIGIYDHAKIFLEEESVIKDLIDLYALDNDIIKFNQSVLKLFRLYIKNDNQKILQVYIEKSKSHLSMKFYSLLHMAHIKFLLSHNLIDNIHLKIEKTLEYSLEVVATDNDFEKDLYKFLSELKSTNSIDFTTIEEYLNKR